MNECDRLLLDSLNSYMNGQASDSDFDVQTAVELISLSGKQKVFPIVYLQNSECFERVMDFQSLAEIKIKVMLNVSAQIQRSSELVRVCGLLKEKGISLIVFKGAVCRAMYSHPEYRISSDEDILVGAKNMEESVRILTSNGYELLEMKGGEAKLINRTLNSILELHSSLVDEAVSEEYRKIGELFRSQLESPMTLDIGCGEIATFSHTCGFLSLCMHFYNHFVCGGIGIRPLMDIACFIKKYKNEIDFDFCFSVLRTVNAEKFIKTVIALCNKIFETDCAYAENREAADMLLDDIISAGIYGTADESRAHSGTVTKSLAHGNGGRISSAFSALFPSASDIASAHPELEGRSAEIRKYRIKRIVGFAGGKGKIKVLQSTKKRKKLLKAVGIIN